MDTIEMRAACDGLLQRMGEDGYSQGSLKTHRKAFERFAEWCCNGVEEVNRGTTALFAEECSRAYGYPGFKNMLNPLHKMLDFHQSGGYLVRHTTFDRAVPEQYAGIYESYSTFVAGLSVKSSGKAAKLDCLRLFMRFLDWQGVADPGDIEVGHVHQYLTGGGLAPLTRKSYAYNLREALEWMHGQGALGFSGRDALPVIRASAPVPFPSYYTEEEVGKMLGDVDSSTRTGKRDLLVLSLAACYGLRSGDIIALRTDDVDYANNRMGIIQSKTGAPLSLPLVDAVRFPLIDYLKNARPESDDPHVLLSLNAPHRPYASHSGLFHGIVTRHLADVGVNVAGRKHGPHAMRHSLASSLLARNVPLPSIGAVLGHTDPKTTRGYTTIDEPHLARLGLEVPHVGQYS
jgi:integrase